MAEKKLKLATKDIRKTFCVRLGEDVREELQALADEFCGGSLSDWLRVAGVKWRPAPEDLE